MRETKDEQSQVSIGEQLILFAVTIVAAILVFMLGASGKWLAAIFCTVPTFAGMISYFRKRMSRKVLWTTMISAFVFHGLLLWVVFGVVLRRREDVGIVACIPGIFLEGFLLYHGVKFLQGKLQEQ